MESRGLPGVVEFIKVIAKEGLSAILLHKCVPFPEAIILIAGLLEQLRVYIRNQVERLDGWTNATL